MSREEELEILFDHIFLSRDKAIPTTRRSDFEELLASGVLIENNKGLVIDYSNDLISLKLISLIEDHLDAPEEMEHVF